MIYKYMDYIPFDLNNPHCLHVMLSNRAYCSIINEAFEHGTDETGGLLIGYIVGRKWYVVDVIDPGCHNTIHETGLFQWDEEYVNRMAAHMRNLYRYQPTILGFWHRHPGSMDYFSQTDVESTQKNLQGARKGLISMLVNIDPALRMTFYYCHGQHFMPIRYDVGDEYFPVELLEYASPQLISQRHAENQRGVVHVSYKRILQPPAAPGYTPRKSVVADNDVDPNAPAADVTPAQPATSEVPRSHDEPEEPAQPARETPEQQDVAPFCPERPQTVEPQSAEEQEIPQTAPVEETPAVEEPEESPTGEVTVDETATEEAPIDNTAEPANGEKKKNSFSDSLGHFFSHKD